MTVEHFALSQELKRVFWPVLNDASRGAVYNTCVAMVYHGDEQVKWHSDTLVPSDESAYVEGAAVLVVMRGMRQMLFTRGLVSSPYQTHGKVYDFEKTGVPSIELADGCAYVWPAGAEGSVDWLTEHGAFRHPFGPGKDWEDEESPWRMAWVFRAIKPEWAEWYSQEFPHAMRRPSEAENMCD